MKTFLKRNWGKILLLLLLLTISILSFKTGYSYLSNDNYSPDLNPILTIKRSLQSPAWRGYRVLGFASESEQADIFRSILYYILDIFLPTWSLSQIFALLSFFVGSWFTALLTSNLVKKSKISRYSELAFLLSGVFYVSTLWTVWVYYQNMFPYITQFGFLPLLLWSIFEVVREFNWKNILVLFISSILFTSTFVIATLFVVDILVIIFLTILFAILFSKSKKEIVKKSVFTILIFISTQLFWILPFVHYTANVSGDIVDSYVNRSITSSVIDLESQEQNALNSAKLFTRTILEEDDNGEYIFDRADEYASYDFFNVVGMIPAFLTVILLIFSIVKKKWIYTVLSIVTFLTWFIIKNVNPPLGSIFVFFQNNIPLFKQVFRWASSKTGNIYLLLLSICAPIGFIYLLDFLGSFLKKPMKIVLYSISTLVIFLLTLFYAQYLFTGDLFPKRALIQIPNEYFQVKQYIEENRQEEERILYLPPANNNYFRTYDWGFWGSNFISYIIPNPIMDLSSAIGSKYGEKAMLDIQQAFRAKDEEKLNKIIAKYEIEYILVDLSLDEEGFTYSWDWGEVDRLWNNFELAYSTDSLYLYKTDISTTEVLIESNSEDIGTFSFFDYSESPKISLNLEVYSNWDSKKGYLIAESEYLGDDILVSNVISESEIGKFPTLVNITDSSIYLYPALPTLTEFNKSIFRRYEYNNRDIIIIDGNVLRKEEVDDEYITIDSDFASNHTISTIPASSFVTENMTNTLSQSEAYECISGTREPTTEVTLQGDATGFDLRGKDGIPCVYSELSLTRENDNAVKVDINWETTNNSLLGYCIYSQNEERCLNREIYFSADRGVGNIQEYLDNLVSKTDYISIILYATNTKDSPDITVRDISVSFALVENDMELLSENISDYIDIKSLFNGDRYQVILPILRGEQSYSLKENSTVWYPNLGDNSFVLENEASGIYQEVKAGFANTSINLFYTQPLAKYLFYWKGENISNIPANLCIAYVGDNKCWIQDILYDNTTESSLDIFTSDNRIDRFDLSMVSTSYNLTTKNLLQDLTVMKYPDIWNDLEYVPENTNIKYEIEADTLGGPLSSTYALKRKEKNSVLTIPQASENGWLAISLNNGIPKVLNSKVIVNGWKQGWDISDEEYDTIYIIYYPNLLAYFGYFVWIFIFILIIVKLIKKRQWRLNRLYR